MHKKTLIAILLAAVGAPAVAAQYFLVAPMPPREDVQGISVNLAANNLPVAKVNKAYSFNLKQLLVVTGDPSYDGSGVRWNMASGELPAGLTMTKGVISGTPDTLGLKQFAVTASYKTHNGTQDYTINVQLEVALAAATLPAGQVGVAYQTVDLKPLLTAEGQPVNGAAATWVVKSGSLPAGLALNTDGAISGTPTAAATAPFVIQATYQTATGQQSYTIGVALVISLAAGTPPQGLVGTVYPGFDLKPLLSAPGVTGFAPAAASWVLKAGSSLPAGLTLNSTTGVITGTPTAAFTGPVSVVAAYQSSTAEQSYQVVTLNIVVVLAPATLPAAVLGQPYTFDFKPSTTVTGDPANTNNTAAYTLTPAPGGLTLAAATGVLSGTPTQAGNLALPVNAIFRGSAAQRTYTLQVDVGLSSAAGARGWADGTRAASCKQYKNPLTGYRYSGATGDGVYIIDPDGAGPKAPLQVYCDMTTDGGGWTLIMTNNLPNFTNAAGTGTTNVCLTTTGCNTGGTSAFYRGTPVEATITDFMFTAGSSGDPYEYTTKLTNPANFIRDRTAAPGISLFQLMTDTHLGWVPGGQEPDQGTLNLPERMFTSAGGTWSDGNWHGITSARGMQVHSAAGWGQHYYSGYTFDGVNYSTGPWTFSPQLNIQYGSSHVVPKNTAENLYRWMILVR